MESTNMGLKSTIYVTAWDCDDFVQWDYYPTYEESQKRLSEVKEFFNSEEKYKAFTFSCEIDCSLSISKQIGDKAEFACKEIRKIHENNL